ncbi:MAG: TIGR01777 family protein [Acidobacteria bacterium]|nr:TIGR01777 family protein [Acidobacteriota bacterium]
MRVVITGASGLIGRRLIPRLLAAGHQVRALGRAPKKGLPAGTEFAIWDPTKGPPAPGSLEDADAVVHLAGEPVSQRWSAEVKRRIRSSRVDGTLRLVEGLRSCARPPAVLVQASAVGYYGDRGSEQLIESSSPGTGFLPEVCVEWEQAGMAAGESGVRVALIRTGVVLAPEGGALEKMLPAFKMGVGGRLGSGGQYMPWIHAEDLVSMICWLIERASASGPFNACAPLPVTNIEFTSALGRALRRPTFLPVPLAALRLLFGEMSEIMMSSQRVIPQAAAQAGFEFRHPEIFGAFRDLLS